MKMRLMEAKNILKKHGYRLVEKTYSVNTGDYDYEYDTKEEAENELRWRIQQLEIMEDPDLDDVIDKYKDALDDLENED